MQFPSWCRLNYKGFSFSINSKSPFFLSAKWPDLPTHATKLPLGINSNLGSSKSLKHLKRKNEQEQDSTLKIGSAQPLNLY